MIAVRRGVGASNGGRVAALLVAALAAGCPDGAAEEREDSPERCADGVDNDRDGYTDCADIQCAPHCMPADADADADDDAEADSGADADGDGDADSDADSDADAEPDAEPDVDLEGPFPCSRTEDCPLDTLTCYDYLLDGNSLCAPRGASCTGDGDCDPRQSCGPVRGWHLGGAFCTVGGGPCASDASCPDGLRCEAGSGCVDRRRLCDGDEDCPDWDRCGRLPSGLRVCVASPLEPCVGPGDCASGDCVDVQGDGRTECQETEGSTCSTNADCPSGSVCGDEDGLSGTECGRVGPCLYAGNCPSGWECIDVNADGQSECQPGRGACLVDADCPPRNRCMYSGTGADGAVCI